MFKTKDNKKALIIGAVILSVFLVFILVKFSLEKKSNKPEPLDQETLLEKQTKELDELRKKSSLKPITEEETESQLKEIETLRQESGGKGLSEVEMQRQIEEINNLRQQ